MIPYVFGSSDALFNLGAAITVVQILPPGVYITMNGGLNLTTSGVSGGYHRLHAFNVCEPAANRLRWLVDVPNATFTTYALGNPTGAAGSQARFRSCEAFDDR